MATETTIRARVRTRLEEASAAAWTDDEIDEGIAATLEEYNTRYELEATATATVAADATTATAPAGLEQVVRVIDETGIVIPPRGAPDGATSDERQAWELFAGVLRFTQPLEAQDLMIWYRKAHTIEDVPDGDTGLLVLGGYWRALLGRAVQLVKRGDSAAAVVEVAAAAEREYRDAWDRRGRRMRVSAVNRE